MVNWGSFVTRKAVKRILLGVSTVLGLMCIYELGSAAFLLFSQFISQAIFAIVLACLSGIASFASFRSSRIRDDPTTDRKFSVLFAGVVGALSVVIFIGSIVILVSGAYHRVAHFIYGDVKKIFPALFTESSFYTVVVVVGVLEVVCVILCSVVCVVAAIGNIIMVKNDIENVYRQISVADDDDGDAGFGVGSEDDGGGEAPQQEVVVLDS